MFQDWQHELVILGVALVITVLLGVVIGRQRLKRVKAKADEDLSVVLSPTIGFPPATAPAPAQSKARPFTAIGAFILVYVATKLCDIAWDSASPWVGAWLQTTGWFGATQP